MSLMKFIGAFIVVLALLLICLRLIGWLSRGARLSKGGRVFNLRGTMALDSKRYLAAVEVDGHLLVVGVAPDRLTSLADWPLEDDLYDGPTLAPAEPQKREARESFPRAVAQKPLAKAAAPKDEEGPSFLEKKSPAPAAEPKEAPKRGRDGPDFTLSLEDEPFEGSTTNDDFKLDLDRE
jgi:flagellar biogenesis protein FliO